MDPFVRRRPPRRGGAYAPGGLVAGVLAPWLFVVAVAVVASGCRRPGFSQLTTFVSELGEAGSPTAGIVNPAFVVVGVLLMWFALALNSGAVVALGGRGAPGDRCSAAEVFGGRVARRFGVVGAGFVVMALWTCSTGCPIAVVNGGATPSDALHNAAAIGALMSLASAALMVGAELSRDQRGVPGFYAAASTRAGALMGGLCATFFLSVLVANRTAIGVSERLLLLAGLAWVEVTAIVARRIARADAREGAKLRAA